MTTKIKHDEPFIDRPLAIAGIKNCNHCMSELEARGGHLADAQPVKYPLVFGGKWGEYVLLAQMRIDLGGARPFEVAASKAKKLVRVLLDTALSITPR